MGLSLPSNSSTVREVSDQMHHSVLGLMYTAALHELHILPRIPSPVPLEERPEEELSAEQFRGQVKRMKVGILSLILSDILIEYSDERQWHSRSRKRKTRSANEQRLLSGTIVMSLATLIVEVMLPKPQGHHCSRLKSVAGMAMCYSMRMDDEYTFETRKEQPHRSALRYGS